MKISCTVEEFAKLVRKCNETSQMLNCTKCPLHELCDKPGFIEQFITRDSITENHEFLNKRMNLQKESYSDASVSCKWRPETNVPD